MSDRVPKHKRRLATDMEEGQEKKQGQKSIVSDKDSPDKGDKGRSKPRKKDNLEESF